MPLTRPARLTAPAGRPVVASRPGWPLRSVAALMTVGLALVGCGGGSSKLSGTDRASTVGVCVTVSGDVATAVSVGVKLAAQSVTPAQAQTQLQPILAKVSAAAQQNARLPVGPKLQQLADSITAAEKADPGHPTQVRTAATGIGSAAKDVLTACAAAAR